MNYRLLGRTGMKVSEVSFGAWAIGASWGPGTERDVIDAPWVQRLRRIFHLQSARWVFPTAEHTRFQHSRFACPVPQDLAVELFLLEAMLR